VSGEEQVDLLGALQRSIERAGATRRAPESLDAILAAAQTGTPDPRPAGPFADPEREARAQAWDEEVERVADVIAEHGAELEPDHPVNWWRCDCGERSAEYAEHARHAAAAALKVIQAERAGEAEAEWEWGVRPVEPENRETSWGTFEQSETWARQLVEQRGGTVVRRIPAGPWEPVPAEGGA
jgi:hypothetical protein